MTQTDRHPVRLSIALTALFVLCFAGIFGYGLFNGILPAVGTALFMLAVPRVHFASKRSFVLGVYLEAVIAFTARSLTGCFVFTIVAGAFLVGLAYLAIFHFAVLVAAFGALFWSYRRSRASRSPVVVAPALAAFSVVLLAVAARMPPR